MDWLDELFESSKDTTDKEIHLLELMSRLIQTGVYSPEQRDDLLNEIHADEYDFNDCPEMIRKLLLNQKSAFDFEGRGGVGAFANVIKEKVEIDNSKHKK